MAGRRAGAGLALAAVALSAAGCGIGGSTKTVTSTLTRTVTVKVTRTVTQPATGGACTGPQLSGTFSVVPGSRGAGHVAYVLTLTNTSQASCMISGRPGVVLLDSAGSPLPTHVTGSTVPAPEVNLSPGSSAKATARFSPDVPGTGDSQSGTCQPKAYTLQVTPGGGGTVNAPIKPPTSVCEQGSLDFGVLASG